MSLVNDMLRDLDARRRDAPTRGLGAEKLVPAAEQAVAPDRRPKLLWLLLGLAVLLAALIAAYLLLARSTGELPAVVLSQPGVPVAQSPMQQDDAPVNEDSELNAAVGIELAQMAARMRELEAQNQSLLRAQQAQTSPQSTGLQTGAGEPEQAGWQAREWTPQADAAAAQVELAATDRAASAPTMPELTSQAPTESVNDTSRGANDPMAGQPQAQGLQPVSAESVGSTVRSPRELSFADSDRLRVQQALQQWNGGQQLAALQMLDTFTFNFPEAHQSREMLAKLLIQQGEPERAMQVVDLGLTIAPRRNGYKKVKARLLLNQAQAAEAVALLSSGAPVVSDDTEYHDLLATGLLSSAAYEQAIITYQSLLAIDERPGRWWYGLAASFDGQRRSQDAAQAYEQALRREDLSAALRQGSQQRLQAIRQVTP
jgi:tetratricopeptide (TPR) repeat protein